MKPKIIHYYCELYRMNFYFCVGWTAEQFQKEMLKRFGYTPEMGGAAGKTIEWVPDDGGQTLIWVWVKKKNDYACLAHECIHAAHFCLKGRGIKPDFDNDEPVAYLVTILMDKALKR